MEEVARYECVYHRNSRDFKDKNKKVNCWEKIGEKFNLSAAEAEVKFRLRRRFQSTYCTQTIKHKSEVKVGSWNSCGAVPIGACNFGTSADRNAGKKSALRSLAIACDYMETTLFAIACDLRFAIRDRLRSSAIIWKHTSAIVCDPAIVIADDRRR